MGTVGTTRRVTVRVPAKINLALAVGPRRPDGFHDLATVYHAVGIYDEVTATLADDWSLTCAGPGSESVPTDATNLALKAARALARRAGDVQPLALHIDKQIPVAGGMAGGSADAAAALVAADTLWDLGSDRPTLEKVAARLGSDVPFLLTGGTAVGSGRGEKVVPALTTGTLHWVLVASDEGLSTPAVYGELDRLREEGGREVPEPHLPGTLLQALRTGDTLGVAACLRNDLEEAAFSLRPDLADVITMGIEHGALCGVVSGSGPTVALLTETHEQAIDLRVSLTAEGVGSSVHHASGPVPGAQIVADGLAARAQR